MIQANTLQTAIRRQLDEIAKRQQPYHVAWVGARLKITPPRPTGVSGVHLGLLRRRSWSFAPGSAEVETSWGSRRSTTRYVVTGVEIAHDVWTDGRGATDRLKVTGPQYPSTTVVALQHDHLSNAQIPPGKDIRWCVAPTLTGSAAERGLPPGVGEAYESDTIRAMAPAIVALSRLITDATCCPLAVVVGSCAAPSSGAD